MFAFSFLRSVHEGDAAARQRRPAPFVHTQTRFLLVFSRQHLLKVLIFPFGTTVPRLALDLARGAAVCVCHQRSYVLLLRDRTRA